MTEHSWKLVYEKSTSKANDFVHKMEVEGGFMYRTIITTDGGTVMSMCFVPAEKCKACDMWLVKTCCDCNEIKQRVRHEET